MRRTISIVSMQVAQPALKISMIRVAIVMTPLDELPDHLDHLHACQTHQEWDTDSRAHSRRRPW
jgi:hypothetical protein